MRRKDLQVTKKEEIVAILNKCKTCHVAMIDGQFPYVVPLSFGYELEGNKLTLYFHSAKEGRKIDVMKRNPNVCFELCNEGELIRDEQPCEYGYYYESLIGNGQVEFIDEVEEKCKALTKMFERQTGKTVEFHENQAKTVSVFKIVSTDFTGKKK